MNRLSEKSEQQIAAALEKVAEWVSAGMDPNDAIVKASTLQKLPVGHVKLAVYAYNTGRTLQQLKTGKTVLEKVAVFPLASLERILEQLYPVEPKTAAAHQRNTEVANDYTTAPIRLPAAPASMQKVAEVVIPSTLPASPNTQARKAYKQMAKMAQEYEQLKMAAYAAANQLEAAMQKLAAYFRRSDSIHPQHVRDNAAALHGAAGAHVLDAITKRITVKRAAGPPPLITRWDQPPYTFVNDVLALSGQLRKAAEALRQAEQQKEAAAAAAANSRRPFFAAEAWLAPRSKEATFSPVSYGVGALMAAGSREAVKSWEPKSKSDLVRSRLEDMQLTNLDARLEDIQTKTLLYDLMLNDPIISGYPSESVIAAYNTLSELVPRAAQRRSLMQYALRKYLAQGEVLDNFDMDQLLDAERKLKMTTAPSSAENQGQKTNDLSDSLAF